MTTMPPYGSNKSPTVPLTPAPGDPLLLVFPLTPDQGKDSKLPLIVVETAQGPLDKKGVAQPYDRLVINSKGREGRFKVLLVPFHMGDPLPMISYDSKKRKAMVFWEYQQDTLDFTQAMDGKTGVTVTRDGKSIVASTK